MNCWQILLVFSTLEFMTSPVYSKQSSGECKELEDYKNFHLLDFPSSSPTPCGRSKIHSPNSGAKESVKLGEYPWMVWITIYKVVNNTNYVVNHCGGSLINNRYVLTSAFCFLSYQLGQDLFSEVLLGEHTMNTEPDCEGKRCSPTPKKVKVEVINPHPKFALSENLIRFDIALLRLKEEVIFNDFISPICLPLSCTRRDESISIEGLGLVMVRWRPTGVGDADTLQKTTLLVRELSECSCNLTSYSASLLSKSSHICGRTSLDLRQGPHDTGVPVVLEPLGSGPSSASVLYGIASSPGYCMVEGDDYRVTMRFTRVSSLMEWVLDNIEE